jgi:hypothetical protein
MSDINPDVLAQMKRIWSAVNDGTLDKDTVNDALRQMHDFLSGAAYEAHDPEPMGPDEADAEEVDVGSEEHSHKKKSRKKR